MNDAMTKPNGWTGEQMRQMADGDDWIGLDVASMLRQGADLYEACKTFSEWLKREEDGFPDVARRQTEEGEQAWKEWYWENLRICDLSQKLARAALSAVDGGV